MVQIPALILVNSGKNKRKVPEFMHTKSINTSPACDIHILVQLAFTELLDSPGLPAHHLCEL